MTFRTFFQHRAPTDDGFALIEVIISAMLVALIVVGTLTGFDAIDRTTADQRYHDEAVLLAAQSQEQLRSDPAITLSKLQEAVHTYTMPVDGTTYTVTESANFVNDSKQGSGCEATAATTSSSKNNGDYLRITSSVTWPQLAAVRLPVSESSIITPPDGSALEIDASNDASPEVGLPGVKTLIKYTAVEAPEQTILEGTTGTAGCLVYGGIPATSATVEVKELAGYVTPSGAFKVPTKEVTIAPNITTHYPVKLNEGGAITAKFMYTPSKGTESSTYEREPGKSEKVMGDTFVVTNGGMNVAPEFEVGSTGLEYETGGEDKYKAVVGKYAASASTPMGVSYPKGDLFPFTTAWSVYAGDCEENDANNADSAVSNGKVVVLPGKTVEVNIPMSYLLLNVYTGTSGTTLETTTHPVKITNTACEGSPVPNNASAADKLERTQNTTNEGHLEHPFQPFGEAKLCMAYEETYKETKTVKGKKVEETITNHRTYTIAYNLTTVERKDVIYVGEKKTGTYKPSGSTDSVTVAESSSC